MLHIVAYDIRDAGRLKKISSLCLDYGMRVQYSIFEFDLDETLTETFLDEVEKLIDPAEDRLMVIPVCANCRKSICLYGQAETFKLPDFYMF